MILGLMITKVQGVEAQENLISTKKETNVDNRISDPGIIASVIDVNPYNFGSQKKADAILVAYRGEVEAERKKKEEEQKKNAEIQKKNVIAASYKIDTRSDFSALYQAAASRFGIDWQILNAVHLVETGGSGNTSKTSYAGARGPMQFMPATFASYAVDGDGDGVKNIDDVDDAVFTAAHYLAKNKAVTDIRGALYRYNHSYSYVERVLYLAGSLR